MSAELPSITSAHYASSTGNFDTALGSIVPQLRDFQEWANQQSQRAPELTSQQFAQLIVQPMPNSTRRIVQVFVADPNENVPLEESVLFSGSQKLTDLTDNELFFEVPIVETLAKHNAKRVTWPDKEASKRSAKEVMLEPARIRDLKMVVVTIAQF